MTSAPSSFPSFPHTLLPFPSSHQTVCLSVLLSVCLSVHTSLYQSVYPSICHCVLLCILHKWSLRSELHLPRHDRRCRSVAHQWRALDMDVLSINNTSINNMSINKISINNISINNISINMSTNKSLHSLLLRNPNVDSIQQSLPFYATIKTLDHNALYIASIATDHIAMDHIPSHCIIYYITL